MNGVEQPWKVVATRLADRDILNIIAFIGQREGSEMAEAILNKFVQARKSLSQLPERGRISPEMKRVNILSYREIQVPPYRIVYQVHKDTHTVSVHIVADGRRNMTELLKERLLTTPGPEHRD